MSHSSEAAKTQPSKTVISASTRVYEQVRRVLSTSRIQAEVERFLIEITIYWIIHGARLHSPCFWKRR